jgi:mono/diheme cytochrome c family protein
LLYKDCAGCHGADPASGILNIRKGITATALTSAYAKVGSMKVFQSSITAADNTNLAAYIKSRVAP